MFISSYTLLGDYVRSLLWLLLIGLVAIGALWGGAYAVQRATSGYARGRYEQRRRDLQARREARRGIAQLEAYLARGHGPRAGSGSG